MRHPSKGYTLIELMAASGLTLLTCLGGMAALTGSNRVSHRAAAMDAARTFLELMQRPHVGCGFERAINPGAAALTCEQLQAQVAQGPAVFHGTLAPDLENYHIQVAWAPEFPSLLRVNVTFTSAWGKAIHHAYLIQP